MRRAALALVALLAAGCGVAAEDAPEPLPPSAPVVLPPTVAREPVPATTAPGPPPTNVR